MRRWLIFVLLAAMLCGCHMHDGTSENVGRPVIQQIVVTTQQGIKTFTNEEKMQGILHKIRCLGQKFTPEVDPDNLPGEQITIELFRSDGTRERYATKGDCFIQQGNQPWKQTEKRPLRALIQMLEELVSDV